MKVSNREDGVDHSPPAPSLLEWDRHRYAPAYLLQRVTEAQVQAAVLDELNRLGITAWSVDAGAAQIRGRMIGALGRIGRRDLAPQVMRGRTGAGGAGLPDIGGYIPGGRALFIECKRPAWYDRQVEIDGKSEIVGRRNAPGVLAPRQRDFILDSLGGGCCAGVVWHPLDLRHILPADYARRVV